MAEVLEIVGGVIGGLCIFNLILEVSADMPLPPRKSNPKSNLKSNSKSTRNVRFRVENADTQVEEDQVPKGDEVAVQKGDQEKTEREDQDQDRDDSVNPERNSNAVPIPEKDHWQYLFKGGGSNKRRSKRKRRKNKSNVKRSFRRKRFLKKK